VIIKKFRPGIFKKNAEKNMHEAVILSKLSDGRVPELLGVINEPGFYGFVLEYKPGRTLRELLFKESRIFTQDEIFSIGSQLISIIKYLHGSGVVHRDIRIPNVLYEAGRVYLLDFGLARFADGAKYRFDQDFSYLGDLLLYLIYSAYDKSAGKKTGPHKKLPWYEELTLEPAQKLCLMKMLRLAPAYESIDEVESDFTAAFKRS
jgi:serine/threonine-protein kinase